MGKLKIIKELKEKIKEYKKLYDEIEEE